MFLYHHILEIIYFLKDAFYVSRKNLHLIIEGGEDREKLKNIDEVYIHMGRIGNIKYNVKDLTSETPGIHKMQ